MFKALNISIFNRYFLITYYVQELFLALGIQQANKTEKNPSPHEAYILIQDVLIEAVFCMAGQRASCLTLGKCFNFHLPDSSILNGVQEKS